MAVSKVTVSTTRCSIEESVEVAVPVRTAYDQWTQFEGFPQFMDAVQRIEQRTPEFIESRGTATGAWRGTA